MILFKKSVPKIILLAITMTMFYVVANNMPPMLGSFRYFWGPLVLIVIFLFYPNVFKQKPIISIFFYGLVSLVILQYTIWRNMSDWNRMQLLEEFYSLLVFSTILFFYYSRNDFKGLAKLGRYSFVFIVITIVMTNIALNFDSTIIRQSASSDFTPSQNIIFRLTGAGGYGYMQALVLMIPIIVYHLKFKKRLVFSGNILVFILFGLLVTMVRAQIFANLLISMVLIVLSFFGSNNFGKSIVIVSATIVLFMFTPVQIYSDALTIASSYFDSDSIIYSKLNDFALFIQAPDINESTGAGSRVERYPLLFNAFAASPLFGHSSASSDYNIEAGGHLYWMNKLTIWGIFGFLFFVFVLIKLYSKIRAPFNAEFRFYYFLSVSSFVAMGLMKNIAGREPFLVLIVVIPGLYFLPLLEKKYCPNSRIHSIRCNQA